MSNQLCHELSPYLLQHAGNPVDWRPWNAEALALARAQQKPIFLSIGYASCHWCHVMAHETFEDPEIARLLNAAFISIKVDREERFDLDQIYMEAVQMMTGRGGWPLSVFLTPEGEPFFGGTYWPLRSRGGIAGFNQVLSAVIDAWQNRRPSVLEQARKITQLLRRAASGTEEAAGESAAPAELDDTPQQEAEAALRRSFDRQWGGFGPAPKFPQPLALQWLLRRWRRSGDDELLGFVTATLDHIAAGGIFDQLGGGFHRYTVDERWLVPHFEKMLYDNALLAVCYLEAWQATGRDEYATVVRQTLDYLLRDMTDPQGGFYSGEDADSEGEEGKFYLWTPAQIEAVLGSKAAERFCRVYDVTAAGNFEGRNILNRMRPLGDCPNFRVSENGTVPFDAAAQLDAARIELLAARAKRIRPARDDKVLVAWNSFAIDALARAGKAFDEPRYTTAANLAADFLWKNLRRDDGRLLHYWRNGDCPNFRVSENGTVPLIARKGQAKYDAYLDDYAGLANALLTLYETGDCPNFRVSENGTVPFDTDSPVARLEQAVALADAILTRFADPRSGRFFYTAVDHEPLIVRKIDCFDNPTPSGNGLAAMLLLRLQAVRPGKQYGAAAQTALRACQAWMRQAPTGVFQLLLAAEMWNGASPLPLGKVQGEGGRV
jgi:uncharacterized protein